MMPLSSIVVTLIGIALIVWTLRYFLGDIGPGSEAGTQNGRQRVKIRVKGGYDPARVVLHRGVPAVLEFFRDEEDSCSERVVLSAFELNAFLPAHQTTLVEFTPDRIGIFPFSCGMGMLRGEIVVTES